MLVFKCDVLWCMLDARHHFYVTLGLNRCHGMRGAGAAGQAGLLPRSRCGTPQFDEAVATALKSKFGALDRGGVRFIVADLNVAKIVR